MQGRKNGKSKQVAVTFTDGELLEVEKRAQVNGMKVGTYLRYIYKRHLRMNPVSDP